VVNSWSGGFQAQVVISNAGSHDRVHRDGHSAINPDANVLT
jgi:hypothetical protein